jgi:hypothetical protein
VLILKVDKVACFHTDLKVLILIGVGGGSLGSRFLKMLGRQVWPVEQFSAWPKNR